MKSTTNQKKDKPWIFRTYAGHSTATESNKLFRSNLEKGQTGLSVAFDLPTQTGYDPDDVLSKGEVGKVGVPISHIGDMRNLLDQIPLEKMNTSMTINATAAWLLALYIAVADEQKADRKNLTGTTQNDIIKEYLSRGTYVFPPTPSLHLTRDVITWTYSNLPKWNPINVSSYHLQEAGATPVQELSYSLATAVAILDEVKNSETISESEFPKVVGRISFFVNAGMRFITELCKMRAFTELWNEICLNRYKVDDPQYRRFRYGVQVNSLGLTELQPENNVYRIIIEMLAVVLSKNARARAVQLPAWNEAIGLPRPFDQQWSLRMQQILAYETDLLEFGDIFDGSPEIDKKVNELKLATKEEMSKIEDMGGAIVAVESGYMKQQLVQSNSKRLESIESGKQTVVGVNRWVESEPSPLIDSNTESILSVPEEVESTAVEKITAWRKQRDNKMCEIALAELKQAATNQENIMEASINCAKVGVTTGEWGATLRAVYGEFRAPTGVGASQAVNDGNDNVSDIQKRVHELAAKMGRRLKFLVGKPGLDGHSNGAEQIAVRARDCGMEVIYEGIRLTPAQIANTALEEDVHIIGLSILSGSHLPLVRDILDKMQTSGINHIPIIVGGIIPDNDKKELIDLGIAAVYTPKDFQLNDIMADVVNIVQQRNELDRKSA